MNHVEKGHYYEQEAADYLISCGYRILETGITDAVMQRLT